MLCQAIRSALDQTYDNIEVVISDNASDDGTSDAVRAIGDPRIRYFRNDTNLGGASNLERCVHLAQGDLFSWLQDDDLLLKGFVAAAVDALSATNASCCMAACFETSTPSSLSGAMVFGTTMSLDWPAARSTSLPLGLALPLAIFESSGIPPAMAFRTDAIRRIVGDFCHTNYPLYAERILIVLLAASDRVVIVPMVGGIFRLHPGQYSRAMLVHTASSRAQYEAFVGALEDVRNAKGLALDDFREFLAEAPNKVVERFYLFSSRRRSSVRLFHDVQKIVRAEYRSRDVGAPRYRIWRFCQDLAPPLLVRLLVGPIQKVAKWLGIRLVV
jgi:glycosyltransferase involved in cell wall biosynthesis